MTSLATALRNATVAIVSENAFARDLTSNAVRQVGAPRIILVRGPADAREQFGALPPTAILFDGDDPGSDALEFTRQLRRGELYAPPATPMVLITMRTRSGDVEAARDAGVTEYMVRPFTVQTLTTRLESALLNPRTFIETSGYTGPCRRRRYTVGYGGPYRRETDSDVTTYARALPERLAIAPRVASIRRLIRTVNMPHVARLRAIHKGAHEMLQVATQIKDQPLFVACNALVAYIERRGPRRGFDPRLVEKHMDGLQALLSIRDEPDRIMLADDMAALLDNAPSTSLMFG